MTVKDKTMLFNITDARTVRVTGQTHLIEVNKVKNQIVSLIFPSGKTLVQGEKLFVKDKPYKMNVIVDTYINEVLFFDLFVAKKTKSTLLLMPMLGGVKYLYFYDNDLINCFIGTKEDGEGTIGLLYRWSDNPLFIKFEEAVQQFSNFNRLIDFKDFIYFEFNIPKKHIKDYTKFINGKYSEFSAKYKDMVLRFHEADIDSQIAQILYKGDTRKKRLENSLGITLDPDAELFSIIDKDLELFDKNYYL